jgi:4-amino-4-deoxy-L-arabinose transferase-like glycosyltransferase
MTTVPRNLAARIEGAPGLYLVLFSLIYLAGRSCSNVTEPFWFDELTTYYLAGLPSIHQIWPLIGNGIELNPPLPFWLTWIVHHTIGQGEFTTRLPALAGYWLLCLCVFQFVRRRSDVRHGFLALLLPVFAYTSRSGTYARGYGLMLGASAAALLCWQYATDGRRRALALPGLTLSIAIAVSCHYYACYVAGALLAGELVRALKRKRIDFAAAAALFAGLLPLVGYRQLMRTLPGAAKTFWVAPSVQDLYNSYADLLGPVAIVFFLFIALSLRWRCSFEPGRTVNPVLEEHEWIVVVVLLAMPLFVFSGAQVSPLAFFSRYVQPVVIGFAIALPLFAFRIAGQNRRFADSALSLLVYLCFLPWAAFQVFMMAFIASSPAAASRAVLQLPPGNTPVLVDNDDDYLRLYHYSEAPVRERLFYLLDAEAAIRYLGSDTAQRSMALLETFHEVHAVDYHTFIRRYRSFLLFEYRPGWMVQKLLADGARMELIREDKPHGYFVLPMSLFRVTLPDQR